MTNGDRCVVLKTGYQINAPFMGTQSRTRVAPETSQQSQALETQGRKRMGGKRQRYE